MVDPYDPGSRKLQDRFDSRRIADRLAEATYRIEFTAGDRALIESAPMFFIATADAEGRPDCSYKGGLPGFVRVLGPAELAWPDYDGNGQFRSLGNALTNPHVGLLFIDWLVPRRLSVNGEAIVSDSEPLLAECAGAQLIVRVRARHIFPNCPRHIHRMQLIESSAYAPRPDYTPPRPEWKDSPTYRDVLPKKDLRP